MRDTSGSAYTSFERDVSGEFQNYFPSSLNTVVINEMILFSTGISVLNILLNADRTR